jgi:hypothetical protein
MRDTNIDRYATATTIMARKFKPRNKTAEYIQPFAYGYWICKGKHIPLLP